MFWLLFVSHAKLVAGACNVICYCFGLNQACLTVMEICAKSNNCVKLSLNDRWYLVLIAR